MMTKHSNAPTATESVPELEIARRLAPRLDARAREVERLGTLPADLVEEVRHAGLFRLGTPRALGGSELAPTTIVEVGEELSKADGSIGWTVLVGNGTAFLAWLSPDVARDLLGEQTDVISSAVFAPTGQLVSDGPGRFRLTGRWAFSSGCLHSDWSINGAVLPSPALSAREPEWRLAVFPTSKATVARHWDVAGLRGTGSHDLVVENLPVSRELTMRPFTEAARHDGPLWRMPFFTLVGIFLVGFPLGVARRALDELIALAPTRIRPPTNTPLAEDGDLQIALTRAEGSIQSARAFVFDAVDDLWSTACRGDPPTDRQRARFLLATQQAVRAGLLAVDTAFEYAGAGVLHLDHPIQRCFRDMHAAAHHVYFSSVSAKRYARNRLRLDDRVVGF